MSRTRKTMPVFVRAASTSDRKVHLVADHCHERGPCTLPPAPKDAHSLHYMNYEQQKEPNTRYACYWRFEAYTGLCGCPLCTCQDERRRERRRDRHNARAELRKMTYLDDEVDVEEDLLTQAA